jgi:hypothetical protein
LHNSKTRIHLLILHDPHLLYLGALKVNTILLIAPPLFAPLSLIRINWGLRAHAHNFPLFFFLGSLRLQSKILFLVVLSHDDVINTIIIALDLLLLDTHSQELLECPILIHGVVVDLKDFKFLWERVEDQINQETILDSQIKSLQSSSKIAHPQNVVAHTTSEVLLRNEPLDESARIYL